MIALQRPGTARRESHRGAASTHARPGATGFYLGSPGRYRHHHNHQQAQGGCHSQRGVRGSGLRPLSLKTLQVLLIPVLRRTADYISCRPLLPQTPVFQELSFGV